MMEHNMNEAERLLKEALEMGLKQDHDKAAVKLNLAVVASAKRKTNWPKPCSTNASASMPRAC